MGRLGRMKMSHMIASTIDELHHMANLIGVNKKHFQNKKYPHYDICLTARRKAVKLGAIEVNRKELIRICQQIYKDKKYKK